MFSVTKIFVFLALCLAVSRAVPMFPVLGGVTNVSESDLKNVEEELQASLTKLAAGEGPNYKISKVHSATRQVVSGTLTVLNVDLIDEKDVTKNCDVSIKSQPWLPQGIEVTFECPGEEKVVKRHDA